MGRRKRDKCAKGKAGFRTKHSTVDHYINLRHIIEKVWEKREQVFFSLLISENALTQFLGIISFGAEWMNSGFLGI